MGLDGVTANPAFLSQDLRCARRTLARMNILRDPRRDPRAGDVVWFSYGRSKPWQCAVVDRIAEGRVYYARSQVGGRTAENVWIDLDGWKQRALHARLRFPIEAMQPQRWPRYAAMRAA